MRKLRIEIDSHSREAFYEISGRGAVWGDEEALYLFYDDPDRVREVQRVRPAFESGRCIPEADPQEVKKILHHLVIAARSPPGLGSPD